MAGKKKPLDVDMVYRLALVGCSLHTIAARVGCSHDTIERRCRDVVKSARADAEVQLLGKVFEKARKGQQRSLELCLYNRLGWSEKPTSVVNMIQNNPGPQLSFAEFKRQVAEAEMFANAIFDGQPAPELTDGNGAPEI
jgi:hypothetical protein